MSKPTDMDRKLQGMANGQPFRPCPGCGTLTPPGALQCRECERLKALGFGTPKDWETPGDKLDRSSPKPASRNADHSGYSDSIKSGKFPPGKERV